MTVETAFTARPYTDSDLQNLCDFLNYCDSTDKLEDTYNLEELRIEFEHPKINKERDLHLWWADEQIVGFAQAWVEKEGDKVGGYFFFRVHPEWRESDLAAQILGWADRRYREAGQEYGLPAEYDSSFREDYAYGRQVLEKNGFEIVRYFFRMQRPLNEDLPEPQFPEGYEFRHVENDADVEAWVEAYNMSFIDHWNFHPSTLEEHKHWLQQPDYDPKRDLLAFDPDGKVAGFCFCWIDTDNNASRGVKEGWINMLGTVRGYRKTGLGRAMLLAGMHQLKAEGMDMAMLGVDAENPSGALRIYESVGFTKRSTSVAYRKKL